MKCFILGLLVLCFSFNVLSITYTTQIHSIDIGKNGEKHIVMLSDGHTAFIEPASENFIEEIERSLLNGDTVQITLDQNLNLTSIQTVSPEVAQPTDEIDPGDMISYTPSVVSLATATNVFQKMRRDYQYQSQCYNRAHIWTYEEYRRSALKSNKLFLFFTSRYIRKYNYKWWFHVTPMLYVGGTSQSNWMTLDRRYTGGPLTTRTWTNVFMYNDAFCPVVYKYSSYRNHQSEQYCYLIPTSMYFWQPLDIERQERTGYVKTQYFTSQTDYAYWEAF
jgi:hypothetical protein